MQPGLAHDLWEQLLRENFPWDEKSKSLDDPIASLPQHLRIAYIYGLFSGQILGNGFDLWLMNGYMESHQQHVIAVLEGFDRIIGSGG